MKLRHDFVGEALKPAVRCRGSGVMLEAQEKVVCIVVVFDRDIAETAALRGMRSRATRVYPLRFEPEPEQ